MSVLLPALGPRLVFFTGGTALRGLSRSLTRYTHNSVHLVTPFDSGGSSEAELLAELLQLAQENVRGVDACRAGADYSNTKFMSFSHAL